jgi:hypothetical protein
LRELKEKKWLSACFSICVHVCVLAGVVFCDFRKVIRPKRFLIFFCWYVPSFTFPMPSILTGIRIFQPDRKFYAFCTLAVYPLYFLSICKLTDEKPLPVYRYWVLLPALLVSLLSVAFIR